MCAMDFKTERQIVDMGPQLQMDKALDRIKHMGKNKQPVEVSPDLFRSIEARMNPKEAK